MEGYLHNIMILGILCYGLIEPMSGLDERSKCCEDTPYTMILYRKTSTVWQGAYDACQSLGLELVSVFNSNIQDFISQWLMGLSGSLSGTDLKPASVWTSGKQNDDDTWQYLDGTTFTGDVREPASGNCVLAWLSDNTYKYNAVNCYTQTGYTSVCQYPKTDSCMVWINDTCYEKLSGNSGTWFALRNLCLSQGGDIALSGMENTSLVNELGLESTYFFIGISRYTWQWQPGTQSVQMIYTSWATSGSDAFLDNACMYVTEGSEYSWVHGTCRTLRDHFLCINETYVATTTETAIMEVAGTTTTTTALTSHPLNVTSMIATYEVTRVLLETHSPSGDIDSTASTATLSVLVYVVPVVTFLVGGVVGAAIGFFVRKRKTKKTNESSTIYVNGANDSNNMSAPGVARSTALDDIQYENVSKKHGTSQMHLQGDSLTQKSNGDHGPDTEEERVDQLYEKPSNYMNVVDTPNVYDQLNN